VFAKGQALFSGSTNFRMASGSSGQDIRSSGGQSGVRSADHGRLRCWPTCGKAALGPCIILGDALRIIGVATKKACDHLLSAYSGRATEFDAGLARAVADFRRPTLSSEDEGVY